MSEMKFDLKGVHCDACKMLVEDIMEELNVEVVSVEIAADKKEGTLVVNTDVDPQKIKEAIEAEGEYVVTKV